MPSDRLQFRCTTQAVRVVDSVRFCLRDVDTRFIELPFPTKQFG